jgi:hypothetical protein
MSFMKVARVWNILKIYLSTKLHVNIHVATRLLMYGNGIPL